MKFELKTETDHFSKSIVKAFFGLFSLSLLLVVSNISIKLGNISRYYEINYLCSLLTVEKSSSIFEKLSNYSKLSNKQKIWDFCRDILN